MDKLAELQHKCDQLTNELTMKSKETNLLLAISNIASTDHSLDESLEVFIKEVCKQSGWPFGQYFVKLTKDSKECWYSKGIYLYKDYDCKFIEREYSFHEGSNNWEMLEKVLEEQRSVWKDGDSKDFNLQDFSNEYDVKVSSSFILPIKYKDSTLAMVEFFLDTDARSNSDNLCLVEFASRQLSVLLERQKWQNKLKQNYEKLNATVSELELTKDQLVQSEKMACIGQLAAGVAHEINNPLSFILSNIETLGEYSNFIKKLIAKYKELLDNEALKQGEHKDIVESILNLEEEEDLEFVINDLSSLVTESSRGALRVKKIVSNLQSFARESNDDFCEADIHKCIDDAVRITWNEIKYNTKLNRNFGEIPLVYCDPGQLNQVILNLIVNASHATGDDGVINIQTRHKDDKVCISIADNGCGIEEEKLKRIFDPFFTTKEIGKGTGLGLSVSKGIVEKHGGEITVESIVGKGTIFNIVLPVNGNN